MSTILINVDSAKQYFPNLQNKTSCCKTPYFHKTKSNKNIKINNETMCITNALQCQIYFKFIGFYSLHFYALLLATK